jgi:membrane protease YdiL (CAAX protease family)
MATANTQPRGDRATLVAFLLLAFGLSWAVWLPAAAASRGLLAWEGPSWLSGLLGAFGPTLAALLVTTVAAGRAGLRGLLGRLLIWHVGLRWYAFALLWPAVHSLAATAIHVLLGGAAPDFTNPPVLQLYPVPPGSFAGGLWALLPFIFLQQALVGSAMGEEAGWRGFALPRLQAGRSALRASLVLGTLWGLWHLPLFLTEGNPLATTFFGWFLLRIVAEAVLYTWVYNNTHGSLLPALLLHASTATVALFLAGDASPLVGAVLAWGAALVVILVAGPACLSGIPKLNRN